MTKAALVRDLWLEGFQVGNEPYEHCEQCRHRWGSHLLHAFENPLNGGWFSCSDDTCGCSGTWDTNHQKGEQADEEAGS